VKKTLIFPTAHRTIDGLFAFNRYENLNIMKIGLALSGGGIRGVAHIGAIKALEEEGIKVDIVSGTSAGSIVGALYANGVSSDDMLDFVRTFQLYKVIKFGWPLTGFASLGYLVNKFRSLKSDISFDSCQVPLKVTMTNLNTGKLKVMDSGDLLKCVAASCAIPMVFEPILINKSLYVDGGVMKNLPASVIRNDCDLLIGVNVMPSLEVTNDNMKSLISIAARTFEMSIWRNQEDDIPLCDVHVEVKGLHHYSLFSTSQMDEIYNAGYQAMKSQLPNIQEKMTAGIKDLGKKVGKGKSESKSKKKSK